MRRLPIPIGHGEGAQFISWHPWAFGLWLLSWAGLSVVVVPAHAQPADGTASATMEGRLQERVRARPEDAAAWRLLGRIRWRRGDLPAAHEAFRRAVQLDPGSAAAHFDLGRALLAQGQPDAAGLHLRRVLQLAPDSDYAKEARELLRQLPFSPDPSQVVQAQFELKGLDVPTAAAPAASDAPRPYEIRLEAGTVYNSNVGLTSLSTEVFPQNQGGAQGFLAPHLAYWLPFGEGWRTGAFLDGNFTLNEGPFHQFNLQHYQPGLFLQRSLEWEAIEFIPRLQYDFTYDAFEGKTFGTRHALTTSVDANWCKGQTSLVYARVDYTNLLDDGFSPAITSQDGWTYTAGLSHAIDPGLAHLSLIRCGVDLQQADLAGSNFAYRGVYLYGEADVPLAYGTTLCLQGGWGYRTYPEFQFTPSRDEPIWRAAVEVRKIINEHWSASGTFTYDLFDSQNDFFKAERFIGGVFMTYRY